MQAIQKSLFNFYALTLAILYATITAGQIFGFVGLYHAVTVIPTTILLTFLVYWFYQQHGHQWRDKLLASSQTLTWLDKSLILAAIIMMSLIFMIRLSGYPATLPIAGLSSDFSGYHAPKALQLAYEHSAWNLNLPYGQYPFGYESLLALPIAISGTFWGIGIFHALIVIGFWLTLAFLAMRYSTMPLSVALCVALLICLIPFVYSPLMLVGKNDMLLALSLLVAILHAPIGGRAMHPVGLALATLISIATKASGLYILVFLWLLVFIEWWRNRASFSWGNLVLLTTMMFPCGFWVLRNFAIMGQFFTEEISSFFSLSIVAQLTNPALYQSGAESVSLFVGAAIFLIVLIATALTPRLRPTMPLLLMVIAITFITTPLSAFHTRASTVPHIEWRYTLYGIALVLVLVSVAFWTILDPIYQRIQNQPSLQRGFGSLAVVGAITVSGWLALPDILNPAIQRADWYQDPHWQSNSIYDWMRDNVDEGVVQIESIQRLYLVYQNPNITVIEGRDGVSPYPLLRPDIYSPLPTPDYFVTPFLDTTRSYDNIDEAQWQLVYQDQTGRIFQRIDN